MKNTKTSKTKRILAALGAFLLFAMYAGTLAFALIDHPAAQDLLMASIACTIILPVLLYAYTLVYRLTKSNEDGSNENCEDSGPIKKTDP